MAERRTRICIDFPSREDAADFITRLRLLRQIPADVGAYRMNALDRSRSGGGITFKDTFVLRAESDAYFPDDRLIVTREEQV